MAVPTQMQALAGKWQGINRLWLAPTEPVRESEGTAVFKLTAQGKFATLEYTWADEGQPQQGLLLFGLAAQQIQAAWVDSWHMQDTMMPCTGNVQQDGIVSVMGHYAAPPGPDWGWRIALQTDSPDQFRLLMYNITPDGEEMLAVEAAYRRVGN